MSAITIIPVPPGKTLSPYQQACVHYAMGGRGTLIADEMGLGKTVEAIGVLNLTVAQKGAVSALIVCPAFLRFNWENEIAAWFVPGSNVNNSLDIVSYHQAQKIAAHPDEESWRYDVLIVDEAHYVKTADTQRSKAIQTLAARADRLVFLTGTPYENAPIELWTVLRILNPKVWDPEITRNLATTPEQRKSHPGENYNFWMFAARYCDLKKRSIESVSPHTGRTFYKKAWDFSGGSNLPELQRKLRASCMVRRMKADVLSELPPKRRQIIVLKPDKDLPGMSGLEVNDDDLMPDLSEENYEDQVKALTAEKVKFSEWSKRRHAQGLAMVSPVLAILADTFAQDRDGKRILFCHHTDVAEAYHQALSAMGLSPVMATGKTHVADRGVAVHRFQNDPTCKVFVGSLRAAGVGLTLTAACGVDFAEQSPVPGEMSQAEDRAHRIGQKKHLHVRIFVFDRSLSARMMRIVVRKQALIREGLDTMAKEEPKRVSP